MYMYFCFRQCMCCYRDSKNFERLNNIVQVAMNLAITLIQTVPDDEKQRTETKKEATDSKESVVKEEEKKEGQSKNKAENTGATGSSKKQDDSDNNEEKIDIQANSENLKSEGENVEKPVQVDACKDANESENEDKSGEKDEDGKKSEDKDDEGEKTQDEEEPAKKEEDAEEATWTMDEKDQLFQFITKVKIRNSPRIILHKTCKEPKPKILTMGKYHLIDVPGPLF